MINNVSLNLLKRFGVLMIGILLLIFSSSVAFAEDDVSCTGKITGVSSTNPALWNNNSGRTSFDDRGSFVDGHYTGSMLDLGILGLGTGYAPPREYAGCSVESNVTDEYLVKGYGWNTNLGFLSMFCDSGTGKNLGINCGAFDYGVEVGTDGSAGAGKRQLTGYAWSDSVGWVNFSCIGGLDGLGNACGGINYGVVRNNDGTLSGHAYTEADLYLNFDGITLNLPGDIIVEDGWCGAKPWACVEIIPDSDDLSFELEPGAGIDGAYLLADGMESYEVYVYLRNSTGTAALDELAYDVPGFFDSLDFEWKDSVKKNQMAGEIIEGATIVVGEASDHGGIPIYFENDDITEPIHYTNGAVVYKPVDTLTMADFKQDPANDGSDELWALKKGIAAIAPTSAGNVSKTTSLNKPTLFKNDLFLYNYPTIAAGVESNDLVLKSVGFRIKDIGGTVVSEAPKVVYANGVKDLPLKFRSIVELDTLYANDFEDKIEGYRGIPVNFKVGAKKHDHNPAVSVSNPTVNLKLDYDVDQMQLDCNTGDPIDNTFDFHFLRDLAGEDLLVCDGGCNDAEEIDIYCPVSGCVVDPVSVNALLNEPITSLLTSEVDLPAVATIADGATTPCNMVSSPGLISELNYTINFDSTNYSIKYYGNKIPRLGAGVLANPAAVIHGNVYAQSSFTPSADVESVQTAGSVNVDVVHDTVKENLDKVLAGKALPTGSGKTCVIDSLAGGDPQGGCSSGTDYVHFGILESAEDVIYFKNSDVEFGLLEEWDGKNVIIVDGGNVYIDSDIYTSFTDVNKLSIVVLRNHDQDYHEAGNIYIHPDVKNIQANIVSDGSIFAYSGNKITGIISPADDAVRAGEPKWANDTERLATLNKQLLIEGSISSRNTIGGADLDSPRSGNFSKIKNYLMLGTGEVLEAPITTDERIRAQLYDLNYLRLFRMVVGVTPEGLPIDQQCGKGLTLEDVIDITNGVPVTYGSETCNGIQSTKTVAQSGDLIPPPGMESNSAQGLDWKTEFNPVYVYYVAPDKKSFLFSKPGALNISN